MKTFPILYHKAKHGDLRQWKVWADKGVVYTEYGTVGGKLQISSKKATPKNVGRSNATTAEKQAELEAQALHTFKLERKYSLTKADACEELMMPMLAKKFNDVDIIYPCSIQSKLDGCLDGDTMIDTEEYGNIPIRDIVDKKLNCHVLSMNKSGKTEYKEVLYHFKDKAESESIQWYEIELEGGQIIRLTGNHPVYLPKLKVYRRADELSPDDIIEYLKK